MVCINIYTFLELTDPELTDPDEPNPLLVKSLTVGTEASLKENNTLHLDTSFMRIFVVLLNFICCVFVWF